MPDADSARLSEPQRLEKLRSLWLMDTPTEPAFDRLTRLAARFLRVPIALVSLVEASHQFLKSQQGLPAPWSETRRMPLSHSFCQHVVATRQPLIVGDARQNPLVSDSAAVCDLNMIAYAGIPLVTSDGFVLGSFCVIDHVPRDWTEEEISTLHDLAASVMTEIELRGELIGRQNVEVALRESYHLTDQIVSTMPDVVYIFDVVARRNLYTNRDITGLLGYSAEQFQSVNVLDMLKQLMHPEDWDRFEQHGHRLMTTPDNTLVEFQYRMCHAEGKWRWFSSREIIFKRDENNQPVQILGIAADVTEWVLTEQTIRENLEQMMLLRRIEAELSESLDLDHVLMTALDAALRLSGAEHASVSLIENDEVHIVQSIGHYPVGKRFPLTHGVVGRALRQREPQFVLKVEADPDYVPDLATTRAQMAIPLLYRDRLIGALNLETSRPERFRRESFTVLSLIAARIAAAVDFASLYKLSQQQLAELQKLYTRVSELEQLKTDMIRIAAHDLRNPLSAIMGFTELLSDDASLTADQQEMINLMCRAGKQMQAIITNILSLQRIEQQGYNRENVDLVEVVRDAFDDSLNRAQTKSLDYRLELPDEPAIVEGDRAQLCEAVDNLISNAIKYTPEGRSVSVKLHTLNGFVTFEVEDTGIGIPKDQQDRLFQPFYRANNAQASKIEGTGLGLHLVKNIIERHGGRMHFDSVYQQGSTFGFVLPEKI
jgi:PAS domain S-box-containing protein